MILRFPFPTTAAVWPSFWFRCLFSLFNKAAFFSSTPYSSLHDFRNKNLHESKYACEISAKTYKRLLYIMKKFPTLPFVFIRTANMWGSASIKRASIQWLKELSDIKGNIKFKKIFLWKEIPLTLCVSFHQSHHFYRKRKSISYALLVKQKFKWLVRYLPSV